QYFDINVSKRTFKLKSSYRSQKGFQENLCRQLKKGIYKMFLEESERRNGNGLDSKFDFIREFARYNLGDYPVIYFERLHPIILAPVELLKYPQLILDG